MAVDVLDGTVEHTALHDAESMLYVLIWMTFTQAGPHGRKRSAEGFTIKGTILESWCPEGEINQTFLDGIAHNKGGVIKDPDVFSRHVVERMDSYFSPIGDCLLLMSQAFFPRGPDLSKYLKGTRRSAKVKSNDSTPTLREDKRPKDDIFKNLKNILTLYIKEVTEVEVEESAVASASPVDAAQGSQTGKHVSDLIAPMQLRDRLVNDDSIKPLPPIQEVPAEAEDGRQLRRSDRVKLAQARHAESTTGSGTSTGKRARTEEGSSRPRKKKSGSRQVDE